MLDLMKLKADRPDALYFAVDLTDAELDETGRAMLAEQEKRQQMRQLKYFAEAFGDVVIAQEQPDPIVCPERVGIPKECIAPIKPASPAPAGEWRRWKCDKCGSDGGAGVSQAEDWYWPLGKTTQHVFGGCGGNYVVIACDKDGREIVAGKRWFTRSGGVFCVDGELLFWVDRYNNHIEQSSGARSFLSRIASGVTAATEITESAARALLSQSGAVPD